MRYIPIVIKRLLRHDPDFRLHYEAAEDSYSLSGKETAMLVGISLTIIVAVIGFGVFLYNL